jgi:hypothetical protein
MVVVLVEGSARVAAAAERMMDVEGKKRYQFLPLKLNPPSLLLSDEDEDDLFPL